MHLISIWVVWVLRDFTSIKPIITPLGISEFGDRITYQRKTHARHAARVKEDLGMLAANRRRDWSAVSLTAGCCNA
jgi:hypothetical protein